MRALFTHLETEGGPRRAGGGGGDASGVAPWQALLDAIRPRLSGERLELVRLAFGKMDKEKKGNVSPEKITQRSGGISSLLNVTIDFSLGRVHGSGRMLWRWSRGLSSIFFSCVTCRTAGQSTPGYGCAEVNRPQFVQLLASRPFRLSSDKS